MVLLSRLMVFYDYKGATDPHLQLMRKYCPPAFKSRQLEGFETLDDLLRVRALGITRVGATATKAILEDAKSRGY